MVPFNEKFRVLIVVDGYFSLGDQDRNDRSFSISWLISILKRSERILLDTAHRDGDHSATIWGKFDFTKSVSDLCYYDEIWLLGYSGYNPADPTNDIFRSPIRPDEQLALANFMESGGGIFASGDHESLGSYLSGRLPRVRTMRCWFGEEDKSKDIPVPEGARRNWPVSGVNRADTLQKDNDGKYHFTNQSDDTPQPLELLPVPGQQGDHHEIFDIVVGNESKVLRHFPDHMHEGETLGYGGDTRSEPWSIKETVPIEGKKFVEYPTVDGHQEKPYIIARGQVIPDHTTTVEPNKLCESGFKPDNTVTTSKKVNTLCAYDGYKANVGRIITDSSWHHLLDLNIIGDPCATGEKTRGFNSGFLREMEAFYLNCVTWLANKNNHQDD